MDRVSFVLALIDDPPQSYQTSLTLSVQGGRGMSWRSSQRHRSHPCSAVSEPLILFSVTLAYAPEYESPANTQECTTQSVYQFARGCSTVH